MGKWCEVLSLRDLVRKCWDEDLNPSWPNLREENARDFVFWQVLIEEEIVLDKKDEDAAMIK